MAENIGSLYVRLGLNLTELETGFVAAEQTVRQGIAKLNRQQNIIKLKMETDLAGLDAATDKAKILETQENALAQVLAMQRDKLRLATAAYQDVANSKGENSAAAKVLESAMERERLAVARLEQQLKSLAAQKVSIDTSQLQDNIARLNARIQNIKISAEIDTSKLQDAGKIFDANKVHVKALTDELELQRQKLSQLREAMYRAAQANGADSVNTLQIKSNVLQQIQQINQLETKLKELSSTDVRIQIHAESLKNVENNIKQNIAQINARLENVRVKTEIDVSKISGAATEFDKAKVHAQGLTQELTLQNKKLAEMKRALSTSISTSGLNSAKTINLQTDITRQIQAIDQLKAKINELNGIQPPKENKLLSGYLNVKGDAIAKLNSFTNAFNQLKGATSSADSAVTSVLGVIGEIPHPVGRAVAALAGLPLIFRGIENSIVDTMKATAAAGDATYVMSRGFQMSIKDTGKFVTMCKTAGVEVNDLASTVKRVQQAIVRGGEDAKAEQWLKRYGESAFDASGHLKDLNDMTLTLSRALKRAQADGNGMAFILGTMRSASADAITAIEDAEGVYKQAAGLVKNGLLDPNLAHETQGNINALNLQASFMNASFESALLPVANEIIPRVTERMGKLTQLIADNKDVIKELGKDLAAIWGGIETVVDKVGTGIGFVGGIAKDIYMARANAEQRLIDRYKDDSDVQTAEDLLKRELSRNYTPQERAAIEASPYLYEQTLKRYEPIIKAKQDARKEIAEENKDLAEELSSVADISSAAASRLKVEDNSELLKQAEAVKKLLQEASDIQYKLSHSDYENKKLDLLQWQQDLLNQADLTAEQREAIEKLYSAKSAQIEQERADKLKEIQDNVSAADKTALQNKLDSIEKERQAWLKAGMDEAEATELSQRRIAKARQEAAEKAQEHWRNAADIEFSLTHTAFEKQLRDIELWKEAKIKAGEETSAIIAEAAAKEAEAFEREVDRIKGKVQSLEDKIFEQEHSQYENDLRKLQQERIRLYEEGANSPEQIERYYQNALSKLKDRVAESQKQGGDYTKAPEGAMQRGGNNIVVIGADQIIDDGLKRANIGVMVDENRIRAQVSQGLSQEAKDLINATQATRDLTDVQKQFAQQAGGFQLIEGDRIADEPQIQQINGDQFVSELQQFGDTLQQINADIEQVNPAQKIAESESALAETLNQAAQDFPADYFKTLADNMKGVSDVIIGFTNDLIDAHGRLKNAFQNTPQGNIQMQTGGLQQLPTDSFQRLSTSTQDLSNAQDLLTRRTRELESLPTPKRDSGLEFGFDHDLFGTLASLTALIPHPVAKGVGIAVATGAAIGKGTYDATTERADERLKPYVETDLSGLIAPLTAIDQKFDALLQSLQRETADNSFAYLGDILSEKLGALPNIERYAQEISQSIQTIAFPTEVIITPLNNINGIVAQILSAIQNREPPTVTVSPNIDINLGGAYVFDDALKKALVNDITSDVVVSIKDAVQQATRKSNYGFSA